MTGPQGNGSAASVERLCALAGVSRASFYRDWARTAPGREETALRRPAFRPATTCSDHTWRIWPNLARKVLPMAANRLWVADITYVRLAEEFIYLAVILDAFSRKVIGWAIANHLQASLAIAALEMALAGRDVKPGELIHHSDRGVQYACGDYIDRLEKAGIQPSMSRAGCPYDNAMAESFMKTLKAEEVDAAQYRDLADASNAIADFINEVYNRQRLHSALSYRPPEEFELIHKTAIGRPSDREVLTTPVP
jgi:putative transposase